MRRRARYDASLNELAKYIETTASDLLEREDEHIEDDRLRLIFTCCYPALSEDTQISMTLREVCNRTTEKIARAFLTKPTTIAQRIVRAKAKIRDAHIPYEVPPPSELPGRLHTVLRVVYLVFNEGYSASFGTSLTQADLSGEAIRLGRLLLQLLSEPGVMGLLALMLLHESRRKARTSSDGNLVLLEEQDRLLWDRNHIRKGLVLIERALKLKRIGPYALQAAIAAVHAEALSAKETDWAQIVLLYELLLRAEPSPIIELNHAVAIAMRDGPAKGLALVDDLLNRSELINYYLAHATQADLCRRLGKNVDARISYERALSLTKQEPERRFLKMRLAELVQSQR